MLNRKDKEKEALPRITGKSFWGSEKGKLEPCLGKITNAP